MGERNESREETGTRRGVITLLGNFWELRREGGKAAGLRREATQKAQRPPVQTAGTSAQKDGEGVTTSSVFKAGGNHYASAGDGGSRAWTRKLPSGGGVRCRTGKTRPTVGTDQEQGE